MKRINCIHVINSFEHGGAEAMLCNLVARADRDRFVPSVVSLIDDLTVARPILDLGIRVDVIGMRPGVPDPRGLARLARLLGRERPHLIQTWMDHSNLIGGLATRIGARAKLVWGIHHAHHVPGVTKRSTLLTVSACARLSRWLPDRIICCSEQARTRYIHNGFDTNRIQVIPNGFDTSVFRPDQAARRDVRAELGLGPEVPLIGLVARHDPVKDHANFLRAAEILSRELPAAHFLLCGDRVSPTNQSLITQMIALGILDRCHLLGPRRDIQRIQAALDIACSSSFTEAFPLAIGEAMACGVPCVATDVGDSSLLIGNSGIIVPPRDSASLAMACKTLLSLSPVARQALGDGGRSRILELFDLGSVVRRYEAAYEAVLSQNPPGGPRHGLRVRETQGASCDDR